MIDFHTLYERHAAAVHRFALFLSGDSMLADDLTSEAFMRVWTASGEIRQPTVRAYLFTVVRNLYRDTLRRRLRHTELSETLPHPGAGADRRAQHSAELRLVLEAIQELPELDRAALLMRAQDEMSYQEIADALELPLSTVKTKVYRARLRLMQARLPGRAVPSPEGAKS